MNREEKLDQDFKDSKQDKPEMYIDLTFVFKWIFKKITGK